LPTTRNFLPPAVSVRAFRRAGGSRSSFALMFESDRAGARVEKADQEVLGPTGRSALLGDHRVSGGSVGQSEPLEHAGGTGGRSAPDGAVRRAGRGTGAALGSAWIGGSAVADGVGGDVRRAACEEVGRSARCRGAPQAGGRGVGSDDEPAPFGSLAPALLAICGCGPLTVAKIVG
jgi:hypothetical protein